MHYKLYNFILRPLTAESFIQGYWIRMMSMSSSATKIFRFSEAFFFLIFHQIKCSVTTKVICQLAKQNLTSPVCSCLSLSAFPIACQKRDDKILKILNKMLSCFFTQFTLLNVFNAKSMTTPCIDSFMSPPFFFDYFHVKNALKTVCSLPLNIMNYKFSFPSISM